MFILVIALGCTGERANNTGETPGDTTIAYVKQHTGTNKYGTSWDTTYTDLETAIDNALLKVDNKL